MLNNFSKLNILGRYLILLKNKLLVCNKYSDIDVHMLSKLNNIYT